MLAEAYLAVRYERMPLGGCSSSEDGVSNPPILHPKHISSLVSVNDLLHPPGDPV